MMVGSAGVKVFMVEVLYADAGVVLEYRCGCACVCGCDCVCGKSCPWPQGWWYACAGSCLGVALALVYS